MAMNLEATERWYKRTVAT